MLQNLLTELGIPYETMQAYGERNIPKIKGKRYKLYGASRGHIEGADKEIIFCGDSEDYGLGFERIDIEELKRHHPDWEFFKSNW